LLLFDKWKQAHNPGPLYGAGKPPLMSGADAGVARVDDFRLTRNVTLQGFNIPIIDFANVFRAKIALFHADYV